MVTEIQYILEKIFDNELVTLINSIAIKDMHICKQYACKNIGVIVRMCIYVKIMLFKKKLFSYMQSISI